MEEGKEKNKKSTFSKTAKLASKGVKYIPGVGLTIRGLSKIPVIGGFIEGVSGYVATVIVGLLCICCFCVFFLFIDITTAVASKDLGRQIEVAGSLISSGCADEGVGALFNLRASGTDFGECLVKDALMEGENSVVYQRNFKTKDQD